MFRHCVMFKWAEGATDEAKAAIKTGLDGLATMDCCVHYHHGPDAGVVDGNWDYVAVGDFASVDDYLVYANDETHQALIADMIKPNISARAAVQYEF